MLKFYSLAFLSTILILSGCANTKISKTQIGAIAGAIGGAVVGKNVGDKDSKNAAIGAIVGGIAGASVGYYMDKQQKELEEKLARERAEKKIEVERLQNNVIKLNLDSNATFAVNKSDLNSSFHSSLTKIADSLKNNDQTAIHVIGHTDSTGAEDMNQRLSEARASSVHSYLNNQGVNSQRIRTKGLGEHKPIADNTTVKGRSQNRRVEIYLKPIIKGQEQKAFESPI